jgi:hypothetical protein
MREDNPKIKAWITKYALTQGIFVVTAEVCTDINTDMVSQLEPKPQWGSITYHGKGRDWHETQAGAVAYAGEMRRKKIVALKKQIAKLEATKFE